MLLVGLLGQCVSDVWVGGAVSMLSCVDAGLECKVRNYIPINLSTPRTHTHTHTHTSFGPSWELFPVSLAGWSFKVKPKEDLVSLPHAVCQGGMERPLHVCSYVRVCLQRKHIWFLTWLNRIKQHCKCTLKSKAGKDQSLPPISPHRRGLLSRMQKMQ